MRTSVNFNLVNFTSDSKMLLEAMPIEDRLKDLNDLDLRQDVLRCTSPEPHHHRWYFPEPPEYPQQK